MGQKVNPIGLRIGVEDNTWNSKWYADKDYADHILEDLKIRKYVLSNLAQAGISKVEIERLAKKAVITLHTSRPGVVIGKKGSDIDKIKANLSKITKSEIHLNIAEIKKPDVDAVLVAKNIAQQLEKRVSFRRAMKRALQATMKAGAKGIKISCAGRLGGAEIARTEWYREGRVPLHTLRANIDYGTAEANTTYGVIGLKVWVFKGEFTKKETLDATKI